jgi:hypothetical protein
MSLRRASDKLRWNIETNLRRLTRALESYQLTSKTKSHGGEEGADGSLRLFRATMYMSASQASFRPPRLTRREPF